MVVFNKTSKIIGVGGTPVLPLAFATVPDTFKGNPILQRMADKGHIVINPSESAGRTILESPPTDNPPIPEIPAPAAETPAHEAREPVISEEADPKTEDASPTEPSAKKKAGKS